jgi:hypothetical protein
MAVFKSTFAGGKPKYGKKSGSARQLCTGIQLHDISVEVPSTALQAGDGVLLYKFPDDSDAYMLFGGVGTVTTSGTSTMQPPKNFFRVDVDDVEDGAGAFVWDIGVATSSDGVADTVIINDSTVGRAAGVDFADVGTSAGQASGGPLAVAGKYIVLDPKTAPTTAKDGTWRLRFMVAYGLKPEVDSSLV